MADGPRLTARRRARNPGKRHHTVIVETPPAGYRSTLMTPVPRRLKAMRLPLLRRPAEPAEEVWNALALPSNRMLVRRARAVRRGVLIALWTLISLLIQSVMIVLPGRGKVRFARLYWSIMCRLLGMNIRVIGPRLKPATTDGRPILYVSNHSSWLDILVLGGRLHACFISKEEVGTWPLVGWIARLGRTVYVRRQRASTGRERDDMRERMAGGDNLILFPEGTSSDGSRVLPFRSAFLSIAELSAHVKLPVGIVRVIVSDLADQGKVRIHGIANGQAGLATSLSVLESVLNGISSL
jgi:1-acyl-sn-glycerol-3-phosphate acyltransferase